MPISTKRPQIVLSERGSTRVPDARSRALAPRRCHRAQRLGWPRLDRVRPECRAANATGSPQGNRNQLTAADSKSADGVANQESPDPASRAVAILGDDVPTAVAQHVRTQRLVKRLLADAPCERFLRTRAVHRALANRTGRDPVGVARDDLVAAETGITLVSLLALDSLGSVITVRTLRAGVALVALRSLGARIALRALRAGGQLADVEVGRHQRPVLDLGSC